MRIVPRKRTQYLFSSYICRIQGLSRARRIIALFLLLTHTALYLGGQETRLDSLRLQWTSSSPDTSQMRVLYDIAWELSRSQTDSALYYARKGWELANGLNDKKGQWRGYYILGVVYRNAGDYDNAAENLNRALDMAEAEGEPNHLADTYYQLGVLSSNRGQYEKSLTQYFEALRLYEESGNRPGEGFSLNGIGIIYRKLKQYEEAQNSYERSLVIFTELGDKPSVADALVNLGNLLAEQHQYEDALQYYRRALTLDTEMGYAWGMGYDYESLGNTYKAMGDNRAALEHHLEALRIREQLGHKRELAVSYLRVGEVYEQLKNYPVAADFLNRALELARQIGSLPEVQECYQSLAQISAASGLYAQAYTYQLQYDALKDSLLNEATSQQLTELRTRFESDRKDAEIAQLKAVQLSDYNRRMAERTAFIIGVCFLLLLMASGGYYFRNKQKQRERKREFELERERSARLEHIDQLKDQFLANTSHELRTPLQGIIGLSETLYERAGHEEDRENLAMIISSGKRLNSLVNDLLDFSKLKNRDIELRRRPVGLHALADIVLRTSAPIAQGKAVRLINEVPVDLPAVEGDEDRLQQILYNLVGNALKFTEKGWVKIWAEVGNRKSEVGNRKSEVAEAPADGSEEDQGNASGHFSGNESGGEERAQMITLAVEDTGIGIPAERQDAIFQAFEQADGSISREYGGTGLGLSITRHLVELHGGRLWVDSTEGKGSTFFFTMAVASEQSAIPVGDQPGQQDGSKMEQSRAGTVAATIVPPPIIRSSGGLSDSESTTSDLPHILIVDDEPINQQVLKNYLPADQFRLTQAMNGEEALRLLESGQRFDLVVLDVMMPRMSGYEVCQRIREQYLPSELPVIMVTAKNQTHDLVQGLGLGANDYLAKPFSKEEFLARVRTQLDLHRIFAITGKFVPNEFLRSIGHETITEIRLGDQRERRVTVLFFDIRDYTSLAEEMGPQENFRFVNAFYGRMGPIIRRHHGFINQYLGDGVMAIFPERPDDALHAAIDMQHQLARYNEERRVLQRRPVRIGIGLHTGPLIMGIIGDSERLDAATIADTVNTASRVESLSKYFRATLLLSKDSLDQLGDPEAFHLRYLGKVQLKGKSQVIDIYECFDGDSPGDRQAKLTTRPLFEEGLRAYFARRFADAVAAFRQVLGQHPEDLTARYFLDKADHCLTAGVDPDWTGVEMMEVK